MKKRNKYIDTSIQHTIVSDTSMPKMFFWPKKWSLYQLKYLVVDSLTKMSMFVYYKGFKFIK